MLFISIPFPFGVADPEAYMGNQNNIIIKEGPHQTSPQRPTKSRTSTGEETTTDRGHHGKGQKGQ